MNTLLNETKLELAFINNPYSFFGNKILDKKDFSELIIKAKCLGYNINIESNDLSELHYYCELVNALAKVYDNNFYELKDYLLTKIIINFKNNCLISYSWGLICIHVNSKKYGESCFHTFLELIEFSELKETKFNGIKRQFLALKWNSLSNAKKKIIAYATNKNNKKIIARLINLYPETLKGLELI